LPVVPQSFYRRNLPRLQRDYKPHFLTFCTYQRWTLPDWARTIVIDTSMRANSWTIDPRAVVAMPDHVHIILVPLIHVEKSEVFSRARITKAIKGTSAHLINRQLGRPGRVWQEESFDRVLRVAEKLDEKIAYILDNPVRNGLACSAEEYRWLWVAPTPEPSFARLGR
jgi:REP element-mobilizing transposase RayT